MEKSMQDVLDKFHYGIYLVTISARDGYNGMIASWVTQCSHEPPLVAVAIRIALTASGHTCSAVFRCIIRAAVPVTMGAA